MITGFILGFFLSGTVFFCLLIKIDREKDDLTHRHYHSEYVASALAEQLREYDQAGLSVKLNMRKAFMACKKDNHAPYYTSCDKCMNLIDYNCYCIWVEDGQPTLCGKCKNESATPK
jgi:hypothetical protein